MYKKYLILLFPVCLLFFSQAHAGEFPIGLSFYISGTDSAHELRLLDSLHVSTLMEPSPEYDVFNTICKPRTGKPAIKIITFDGPNHGSPHQLWWDHILGYNNDPQYTGCWAINLPNTQTWHDTVDTHLVDIKTNYIDTRATLVDSQGWAGLYFDEYPWHPPFWDNTQWSRVIDTVFLYIHDYWNNLNIPDYQKKNLIYSAATSPFTFERQGLQGWDLTFSELAYKLQRAGIGIMETDIYRFLRSIPKTYITNSDSFIYYQDECVRKMLWENDTCRQYFEREGSTIKWYTLIATSNYWFGDSANHSSPWLNIWRYPSKYEISMQGWLSLSRGVKGIRYFCYYSTTDQPGAMPPPQSRTDQAFSGLLYANTRTPRSKYLGSSHQEDIYDTCADYRIFDWVKEFNDSLVVVGPYLADYRCVDAFGVNTRDGQKSSVSYVKNVIPVKSDTAHSRYNYFEVGCFKPYNAENDTDHFIVASRYCQQQDTVQLFPKLNYRYPYRLYDVLHRSYVGGQKPSRDTMMYDTIQLMPGGGKLLKVEPDIKSDNYFLTGNINDSIFHEYYSYGALKANANILNNSNIVLTAEGSLGSVCLDTNFTLDLGSTLIVQVVPHLPPYYISGKNGSGGFANIGDCNNTGESKNTKLPLYIFELVQNYPNPCNGITTIKYQLPKPSVVRLSIYNIAGQLVKQYDMGAKQPGYYNVRWDASRVANGVYFYKLNAGDYQSIKKMMVLK